VDGVGVVVVRVSGSLVQCQSSDVRLGYILLAVDNDVLAIMDDLSDS
jgi:hypothetical protein